MEESIPVTTAEKCYESHLRGSRMYYNRNKEKISTRMKEWYIVNKETLREYKRQYYVRRKEKMNSVNVTNRIA